MHDPANSGGVYPIKRVRSERKSFVLWREVIMAYLSPAIMASIGGWITADKGLQIGALTTIGGTSALIAVLLGRWLQSHGIHKRWVICTPHMALVTVMGMTMAVIGLLAAWLTTELLIVFAPGESVAWLSRVWIDFPLSAIIASTLITWRWRSAIKK
ncbi:MULTISPECIES: hypothetical protein [Brevibacillus]|uniref:Uncharacterized protein n=1 Tax=Brevibacillus brevis TaxID=1393 RepID=A0A2Z4MN27_BREBE|nr:MULTISPECIES: hypothetical protein [Brevibacillus]AWX57894.1 hypothetical protein AB432_023925 [Brevibacillus brevis]NRR21241.1 hypothetical protein [Brevibacillus sp. MS2.2]